MHRTLIKTAPALILAALTAPAALAADHYTVDAHHTWPTFEVNHLGFSTQRGRFNQTAGEITLDVAAKQGSVTLAIQTASLDMGFDKWNEHLKSDTFFNVAAFPTMKFSSNKLRFDGDRVVAADGEFTLLGVTRPLTVSVSNFRCGQHPMTHKQTCGGDISATFKRSDFGMNSFIPAVGDEVKISVPLEAAKD